MIVCNLEATTHLVGVYSQKTVQRCTLNPTVRFIFAWTEDGNVHTHALFSGCTAGKKQCKGAGMRFGRRTSCDRMTFCSWSHAPATTAASGRFTASPEPEPPSVKKASTIVCALATAVENAARALSLDEVQQSLIYTEILRCVAAESKITVLTSWFLTSLLRMALGRPDQRRTRRRQPVCPCA